MRQNIRSLSEKKTKSFRLEQAVEFFFNGSEVGRKTKKDELSVPAPYTYT